jgi:sodium-coupled neutral amino acid transporter 11
MFPTREAIQKSLGFETATKQPSNTQHYMVTVFLFIFVIGLSVSIRSLGIVYALVGGFSATTLANILPATAYFVTRRVYFKKLEEEEDQQQQKGGNYYPGNSINNNMLFPTLTGSTTITPDENDLKSPLLWETQSYSSSSRTTALFDDDVSTVDGDAYLGNVETQDYSTSSSLAPHWLLDIAAGLLICWGFVVMFFSISSTLKGQ